MPLAADHPADPAQPGTERHAHFPCFDGLRAVAAGAVLLHHVGFQTGWSTSRRFGELLAHGDAGVPVFFVISGFLLYRPFVAAHLDGRHPSGFRRFMRRRVLRIVPAYWVALVAIALLFGFENGGIDDLRDVVVFFGFAQTFDPERFFHGISQAWSLGTEMCFYLFLPLYAAGVRAVARRVAASRLAVEVTGLVLLYATSVVFRASMFALDDYWRTPDAQLDRAPWAFLATAYWLPSYLDVFALGMGLALLSVWAARAPVVPAGVLAAARRPGAWWLAAGAAYLVVSFALGLPSDLSILDVRQSFARQFLYGLTALFLVVPAVLGGDSRRGLPRRFLLWRPVAFVGLVSYGVYLWHQAWISEVSGWIDYALFPPDGSIVVATVPQFVVVLAGALALTVVTATVSYYLVERPVLRFKDPRPRRRAGAGVGA